MAELTPEMQANGIFQDAAGNLMWPDGTPALGGSGLLGAIGAMPDSNATEASGAMSFNHGTGDVPALGAGYTSQNIVEQFGKAPSGDLEQPFWSDVTPGGDTTGVQTIYHWNNAPDPRVDEWYAEHPADPSVTGQDPVSWMTQMLHEIPDAGKGTSMGQAGTLHRQAINTFLKNGGDPAEAGNQHATFYGGGEDNPSTDNWRLLPPPYNQPGYAMRNGIVINTRSPSFAAGYPDGFMGRVNDAGQNSPVTGVYSPHTGPYAGYPASYGFRGMNYGWPGALWGWTGQNWDMG